MTTTFKRFSFSALLALCLLGFTLTPLSAAGTYPIIVNRSFTAAGALTSTVTAATNATPIVVTTSAAHKLVTGDQIAITGAVGNTAANGIFYINVVTSTTFQLFSDINLATAVAGNGAWTSGGAVSPAYDVASVTGDFTINLRLDSLTAAKNVLVSIEESEDGFVSDIRTLWVVSFVGGGTSQPGIMQSLRKYQLPDNRFGATGGLDDCIRVKVQAIDSSTTVQLSAFLAY